MPRPNSDCWRCTAKTATCSRLDSANDSRQRIVVGRAAVAFRQKVPAPGAARGEAMMRRLARLSCRCCSPARSGAAQDPGTLDTKPLPPLANPDEPSTPARELFARKTKPARSRARSIGCYAARLPGRRGRAADQRIDLAGDAAVAQSQLGTSEARRLSRAARRETPRRSAGTACWSATCRSRAAGPCSPAMPAIRSASTPTSG